MTGLLLGLALAVDPGPTVVLWSPVEEIDPAEGLFLQVVGLGCADLEVVDDQGLPEPFFCELLGPGSEGEVLWVGPDPAWATATVGLETGGLSLVELPVVARTLDPATVAIPVVRTVASDGVSFKTCHDGVAVGIVRADAEPTAVDQPGVVLGPDEGTAYFGVSNGRWAEAAPGLDGSFWFTVWDAEGMRPGWFLDEFSLASAGKVRTDIRFGYDPELGLCPSSVAPWTLGEEVDAQGGETPVARPPEEEQRGGCGCATGGGSSASWWLVLLVGLRRYQPSSST